MTPTSAAMRSPNAREQANPGDHAYLRNTLQGPTGPPSASAQTQRTNRQDALLINDAPDEFTSCSGLVPSKYAWVVKHTDEVLFRDTQRPQGLCTDPHERLNQQMQGILIAKPQTTMSGFACAVVPKHT